MSSLRRALSWILLVTAIGYLCYFLFTQWQALASELALIRPGVLIGAIAAALVMVALKSCYHAITFQRLGQTPHLHAGRIVSAYATSQLVRYLPGKVLGVVYEAGKLAPEAPVQCVVAVNIVQGLYTTGLTIGVLAATAAWFFFSSQTLGSTLIAAALALTWTAHQFHLAERLVSWAAKRIPRFRRFDFLPTQFGPGSLLASLVLLAEWVPYFIVWGLLAPTDTNVIHAAILLGSCYAGASLSANLAVVAPSGLFVREAIFVWVGSQLMMDPATLIVLGMLSRLIFTTADVALAPLAWAWSATSPGVRYE